jgi:hypothetical protein
MMRGRMTVAVKVAVCVRTRSCAQYFVLSCDLGKLTLQSLIVSMERSGGLLEGGEFLLEVLDVSLFSLAKSTLPGKGQ